MTIEIRIEFLGFAQSIEPVGRLAHDFERSVHLEGQTNQQPHAVAVVDYQYPCHALVLPPRIRKHHRTMQARVTQ